MNKSHIMAINIYDSFVYPFMVIRVKEPEDACCE